MSKFTYKVVRYTSYGILAVFAVVFGFSQSSTHSVDGPEKFSFKVYEARADSVVVVVADGDGDGDDAW